MYVSMQHTDAVYQYGKWWGLYFECFMVLSLALQPSAQVVLQRLCIHWKNKNLGEKQAYL